MFIRLIVLVAVLLGAGSVYGSLAPVPGASATPSPLASSGTAAGRRAVSFTEPKVDANGRAIGPQAHAVVARMGVPRRALDSASYPVYLYDPTDAFTNAVVDPNVQATYFVYGANGGNLDNTTLNVAGLPAGYTAYVSVIPYSTSPVSLPLPQTTAACGPSCDVYIVIQAPQTNCDSYQVTGSYTVSATSTFGSQQLSGGVTFYGYTPAYGAHCSAPTAPPAPSPPPSPFTVKERGCGRCNGTTIGAPIDVATGEEWNEKADLDLSGPFGLSFHHFYANQSAGSADLGTAHWRHNYSGHLDFSGLSGGAIAYFDYQGIPHYFTGYRSAYPQSILWDSYTGMALTQSADKTQWILTDFDWKVWTFNAAGELVAIQDRIGNSQTLTRDTISGHNDRLLSVKDALGRSLCFYYDTNNRITAVAAWMHTTACPAAAPASSVTSPVVKFTYDTGTNCVTGDLCKVTEADGKAWSYRYTTTDTVNPTNLSEVLDPLGDAEEITTYSGLMATHQETGNCSPSPCSATGGYFTIQYPAGGSTTATVTDGLGRITTITYDPNTLLITQIAGPMCRCGGDQTRTYTYDSYQRMTSVSDDGTDGSVPHTITYVYGRDLVGVINKMPGPSEVIERLDTVGTTRFVIIGYGGGINTPLQNVISGYVSTSTRSAFGSSPINANLTLSATGLVLKSELKAYDSDYGEFDYISSYSYDARGRMLTRTGPRTDVVQTSSWKYFSDTDSDAFRAGQLSTATDALGHTATYATATGFTSYDAYGHPQSVTDPNGATQELTYDARGRTLSSTLLGVAGDTLNLTSSAIYDSAGRTTRVTLPAGNAMSAGYDSSDRVTSLVRLDSALLQHERANAAYNAFDQVTSRSLQGCTTPAASCGAWSTTWNQTYAYSPTTADMTNIVNADGTKQSIVYNLQGQVSAINDENHPTGTNYQFSFDLAGRRLAESRALPSAPGGAVTTHYTYNLWNRIMTLTDPNGNITSYVYDDLGRLQQESSPITGLTKYTYDPSSNILSIVDADGASTTFTYDALNRPLTETDTKAGLTTSETWTYDDATSGHFGINRLASVTDPSGSTSFAYDRRGNVTVENHLIGSAISTQSYSYDKNGNVSSITYPDGRVITYTYDYADRPFSAQQTAMLSPSAMAALRSKGLLVPAHRTEREFVRNAPKALNQGLPVRLIDPHGRFAQLARTAVAARTSTPAARSALASATAFVNSAQYAPFGPLTSISFGNGSTQTTTYNRRYLPTEDKTVGPTGTSLIDRKYVEDSVGNVTTITDVNDAGYNRSFSYDGLNRLTTANSGASLWGTAASNGYVYDSVGNLQSVHLGSARNATFSYLGAGKYPTISSVTDNGTVRPVSYDAAGSELTDGTNTFSYGTRELLGAASPQVQAYAYDGSRRRVQTTLPNGTYRDHFYDRRNNLLAESALTTASTPTIAYDYAWFGNRPVAEIDAAGTHWTSTDFNAVPWLQTDINAVPYWQAEYQPDGTIFKLRAGDVHQPLRLVGQSVEQFDNGANSATELTYNGARWYRSGWERYSQVDPAGIVTSPRMFAFNHAQSAVSLQARPDGPSASFVSLYSYADDNPIMFNDPTGLWPAFKVWGNYCGPGWTMGIKRDETSLQPQAYDQPGVQRTTDALDDCCKAHDRCHSAAHWQPCGSEAASKTACDEKFISCASASAGIQWAKAPYDQHTFQMISMIPIVMAGVGVDFGSNEWTVMQQNTSIYPTQIIQFWTQEVTTLEPSSPIFHP